MNPGAGYGAAHRRGRRRDVGIGAVVEVQEGALGALQQDGVAPGQHVLDQNLCGLNVAAELLRPTLASLVELRGIERVSAVELDMGVLLRREGVEPGLETVHIPELSHADAPTGDLVHVGRSYAAARGAKGVFSTGLFLQAVQCHVVGHDDVGAVADDEPAGVDVVFLKSGDLG